MKVFFIVYCSTLLKQTLMWKKKKVEKAILTSISIRSNPYSLILKGRTCQWMTSGGFNWLRCYISVLLLTF